MTFLHELPTGPDCGPMSAKAKVLCVLLAVITSPLWIVAALVVAICFVLTFAFLCLFSKPENL